MSDKADQSAGPIIEAFGGIRPMAAKLGAPVSTVQGWKQRGTIPAGRMAEIRNVAAQHDITLPPPGENTPDENGADRPVDRLPRRVTQWDTTIRRPDPV